ASDVTRLLLGVQPADELFVASGRTSPDGRWLAYVSNETGRDEVYVQAYPGPGVKVLVSPNGGMEPAWAKNGRELFSRSRPSGTSKMMAVNVALTPTFWAGVPRALFEDTYGTTTLHRGYDVAADSQRFLMIQFNAQPRLPPITQMVAVLNWSEELKQRVP